MSEPHPAHQTMEIAVAFFGDWKEKRPTIDLDENQKRFVRFANGDDSLVPDPDNDDAWDRDTRVALVRLLRGMRAQWQVGELYRQTIETALKSAAGRIMEMGKLESGNVMTTTCHEYAHQSAYAAGRSSAANEAAQIMVECVNHGYEAAQKGWD